MEDTKNKIPTSQDFTQKAIKKALMDTALDHWSFRYSLPAIAGTGIVGALFGFSYPIFLVMLGILGGSASSFVYNTLFKGQTFEKKYVENLHKIIDKHTEEKRKNLKEDLLEFKNLHGARQLEQFDQKFEVLVEVLNQKFDSSQLTYQRYYGISKEVYLSGIDNLNRIMIASKTMNSIDLDYIDTTLKEVSKKDQNNMAVKKEMEALQRSRESYYNLKNKIDEILAENEAALTQIDQTTIAISEITRSKNNEAQMGMENSMQALEEMAMRSTYYSR
ncbi:MAG: hypothetical protein A2W95_02695 [Bacteroidetes bacterium GWA2_40_14]|jgi:hypothetical protein|nr:MAG: hypothetical protein A2W95_02695 [Bacteroidetes bacterium GWA2_40_14]HAZ03593.1 hypothetical protein [Marinilabiliales bacterium]